MIRSLVLASVALASGLAMTVAPASAQDQRRPPSLLDEMMPVVPGSSLEGSAASGARSAPRTNHMADTNQFRRGPAPRPGALRPMYGSGNSLQMERYAPAPANQPIKAPPRPR